MTEKLKPHAQAGSLTFDLEDHEARNEFLLASQARLLQLALSNLGDQLRTKDRYEAEPPKTWEEVRDLYYKAIEDVRHLMEI